MIKGVIYGGRALCVRSLMHLGRGVVGRWAVLPPGGQGRMGPAAWRETCVCPLSKLNNAEVSLGGDSIILVTVL